MECAQKEDAGAASVVLPIRVNVPATARIHDDH